MLFAVGPADFDDIPRDVLPFFFAFLCGCLVAAIVVLCFFLLSLHRCLKKCSPRNRAMEPGMVWLNLVPCLNLVWQFLTVIRVAESLRNEFEDRGIRRESSYGKSLGLAGIILNITSSIIDRMGTAYDKFNNNTDITPFDVLSSTLAILAFVLFLLYWVRIVAYSRELDRTRDVDDYDSGTDRNEWDDDRPRRRKENDDGDRNTEG